jgi:hypothetical protein
MTPIYFRKEHGAFSTRVKRLEVGHRKLLVVQLVFRAAEQPPQQQTQVYARVCLKARIETPHPDWTALLLRPVRPACGKHLFVPNFILVSDARVHQIEYFSLIGHPFIMGDPTVSIGVNLSRQFRAI